MDTGGWVFMSIGMVILLVLLVAVIWWIVSQPRTSGQHGRAQMSAREVLDHRLVDGEITVEQYDELRKKLDTPAPAPG